MIITYQDDEDHIETVYATNQLHDDVDDDCDDGGVDDDVDNGLAGCRLVNDGIDAHLYCRAQKIAQNNQSF